MTRLQLRIADDLLLFLPPRRRRPVLDVTYDGTSSLLHVIESLGVPRTEIGGLVANGEPVQAAYRPGDGAVVEVRGVTRPQRLDGRAAFVLDVHLGTLARRLRLLGVDTAYANAADDETLVATANDEDRILLTRDRGLLRRRGLRRGGYVRGDSPDHQVADVLDRFAPPLAPWTRCLSCNAALVAVAKPDVADRLPPGTRRTYDEFATCRGCERVYWRGAHAARLERIVAAATGKRVSEPVEQA